MNYQLTESQIQAVNHALENDVTAIRGSAGSGKTLVAATIANSLAQSIDLFTLDDKSPVMVVTYTNALVGYLRTHHLNESIKAYTVHSLLKSFLSNNGKNIFLDNKKKDFLNRHLDQSRYSIDFVSEEIKFIFGRGLKNKEAYMKAERIGRGRGRVDREYLFSLFTGYLEFLNVRNSVDYDDIGNVILDYCKSKDCSPIAKHLIIDEIQDLPMTIIQALQKVTGGKLVYIGDIAQSIYGRHFTWKGMIGQRIVPIELKKNFRNTQQIFEAADSILKFEYELDKDSSEEFSQTENELANKGERPQLFFCNNTYEIVKNIYLKVEQIQAVSPNDTICLGYRKNDSRNRELFKQLEQAGLRFNGSGHVHKSTLHSMKGLEFDHVLLLELDEDNFFNVDREVDEDTERRLLFVSMTRARKTLSMFSSTDVPLRFLSELSPTKILPVVWNSRSYEKTYCDQLKKLDESRFSLRQDYIDQNNKINDLELEIERLIEDYSTEMEEADSLLSTKDTQLMDLEIELNKVLGNQRDLERRLDYFTEQKENTKVHLDITEKDYLFKKDAKVLMLGGDGGIKKKDISGIFKSAGLPKDAFEHISYDEVTNFNINNLMYTNQYSDIFVSTVPHKAKGIGSSSSLVDYLTKHKKDFPKVTIFRNPNGSLVQFSKSLLKDEHRNSDLYASMNA